MGIENYNNECRKIVMRYSKDWEDTKNIVLYIWRDNKMHFKHKNKDIWNNVMDSFASFLANVVKKCRKGSEGTA
jgi:isoleucyl-tRNA synthetase